MQNDSVSVVGDPAVVNFTSRAISNFWAKVDRRGTDECWLWKGSCLKGGYGQASGGVRLSHRMSFVIHHGQIPNGMRVLHKCDNPPCCNPEHLFTGTAKENSQDMVRKGRSATGDRNGTKKYPERMRRGDNHGLRLHPECIARGERRWNSKLTTKKVVQIRTLRSTGATLKSLADQFGVADSAIYKVISRKTWSHVT